MQTELLPVALGNYIGLSAVIFFIGVAGVLLRRNPLIMLMSIELMWNAANLLFLAFARAWLNNAGHIFAFLVITVAAAEETFQSVEMEIAIEEPVRIRVVAARRGDWNVGQWSERFHGFSPPGCKP